jgi:Holliday junction DNA helicase RuvA
MIESLKGTLLRRQGNALIVDVGGVGYGVTAPGRIAAALGPTGAEVMLWVRTWVREDALRLYGFARIEERDAFDLLLGVPGVGPGICLAILSELTVGELLQAALSGDTRRLTGVKGIGKKSAEKILHDLKDKTDDLAACLSPGEAAEAAAGAAAPPPAEGAVADAVAALETLDVPLATARKAVAKAVELLGPDAPVEALVREALRHRKTV